VNRRVSSVTLSLLIDGVKRNFQTNTPSGFGFLGGQDRTRSLHLLIFCYQSSNELKYSFLLRFLFCPEYFPSSYSIHHFLLFSYDPNTTLRPQFLRTLRYGCLLQGLKDRHEVPPEASASSRGQRRRRRVGEFQGELEEAPGKLTQIDLIV
jgi:hypothetical protein